MAEPYPPFSTRLAHMLHGADYNPEQWPEEVWTEDLQLMQEARCNVVSVGIFAWSMLEPRRGRFRFDWLDRVLDGLERSGIKAFMATPSGAKPAWLAHKTPEVRRVRADRVRELPGGRHNHCPTSPAYRKAVAVIDGKLAERYGAHPAVIGWHVSNEYGGACHCDLCQNAFRQWLRVRYDYDIERLNQAWWTTFWSHRYSDWNQIESPCPHGEEGIHGLNLDWRRFVTHQTIDFYRSEVAAVRRFSDLPVTTNFMGAYPGLDYGAFAEHVDVVAWDSYPAWHQSGEAEWMTAARTGFLHDLNRGLKNGRPFLLMESTPSATNWQAVNKLKRP
ncbi:MAG: beta-galactosidase, partial [Planctomycetota bacterium]